MTLYKSACTFLVFCAISFCATAQEAERWDKNVSGKEHPNIQWFKDAKFGMFIHWGLFSQTGGTWDGKNFYGISEWMMNRGKIPAKDYATIANSFNPTQFDAKQWAKVAKDAGMKYMVITAKHHEGFAMFDSKVSDFNIVKATPYGKDPMKPLSEAVRAEGLKFGFYYSQYLDWHEPNGGGNKWDFDDTQKDTKSYYRTKSIPQIKELLSNYGPLGVVWFDMPGGLTKEETQSLIDDARRIQPNCLISSRVGNGLGDFKDYGDGEVPATVVAGAWEALFTHNDSWGYSRYDYNFKTPKELIRLLATVSSKGGNLILNVGPDGSGRMPEYSVKYLREVGQWLKVNGDGIYGTTAGNVPPQPWGVSTAKFHKTYLHIFDRPKNGIVLVPSFPPKITKAYLLAGKKPLIFTQNKNNGEVAVKLPANTDDRNTVIVLEYGGKVNLFLLDQEVTVSRQFAANPLDAVNAKVNGKAAVKPITHSNYFGDWKHTTCITNMAAPQDSASFVINVTEPGDYKITLEYACDDKQAGQEGILSFNKKTYPFQTLAVNNYDSHKPLMFIKQTVAIVSTPYAGLFELGIKPMRDAKELFKLKTIWVDPVH